MTSSIPDHRTLPTTSKRISDRVNDQPRDPALPLYLNPHAEHLLDWFHVTMRLTVLNQMAKSVRSRDNPNLTAELGQELERLKWYLWHGNLFLALQTITYLQLDADCCDDSSEQRKLSKAVAEFGGYIRANATSIPNYGERFRAGETISSAQRAGPTAECVAVLRQLSADGMLGRSARSLLSLWRLR